MAIFSLKIAGHLLRVVVYLFPMHLSINNNNQLIHHILRALTKACLRWSYNFYQSENATDTSIRTSLYYGQFIIWEERGLISCNLVLCNTDTHTDSQFCPFIVCIKRFDCHTKAECHYHSQ